MLTQGIGPIVRGNFPSAQDEALYMGILPKPVKMAYKYKQLYTTMTSKQAQEKFARYSGLGLFQTKPVGGSPKPDSFWELYFKYIRHVSYGKRIDIVKEALEDDPKGIIKRLYNTGTELRDLMEYTKEQLHFSFLTSRWDTATAASNFYNVGTSYYPLFSTAHPTAVAGVTYRNRFTNAVQLNRATLESAVTQMAQNNLLPRGRLQLIEPETLLVGYSNKYVALRLLSDTGIPESNDNGVNFVGRELKRVLAPNLFADDGRWAIVGAKDEIGMATFDRIGMETETLGLTDTLNISKVIGFRLGFGGLFPDGWFGSIAA